MNIVCAAKQDNEVFICDKPMADFAVMAAIEELKEKGYKVEETERYITLKNGDDIKTKGLLILWE